MLQNSGRRSDLPKKENGTILGAMLKQAREESGITQEELATRLHTRKSAISRIENHAEDIKLSTLEKFAHALGKHLRLEVA